ncbi:ABC transporter permease [Patulibacter defluvii]|uniref:ABC transporter permease n=1 Tax=Patulibacter defluvii TaxID=3095358 RepID=UPI002A74FD1B|nr:ABC transporter permease [Patulibacter sp. DM4]
MTTKIDTTPAAAAAAGGAANGAPTPTPTVTSARRWSPRKLLAQYALVLVLLGMIAIYSALAPDTFFTFDNLKVVTSTQAVLMVAVLGLVLPFAAGEYDMSFGATLAWATTLTAVLTVSHGWALGPALVVVLLSCVLIGAINAFFIVVIGISSLIATLGSGTVIIGFTLAVSKSQVLTGPPELLTKLTTNDLFGLPYPVYFGLLLAGVLWFVLEHTPIGRYVYFAGEGRAVARLSGLPVDWIRGGSLMAASALAGLAGVINFGRLGSADPNLGMSYLLPGAAAVFLGAAAIKPGRFNAWGTVIAVYVLVVGVTGLQLLGGAGWLENVFNGSALVLAITFAHLMREREASH